MDTITRIPAYPLITHDPMFSIWSYSDFPNVEETVHWTGAPKTLRGAISIDGAKYRFLGRSGGQPMPMVASRVTPLSTEYQFRAGGILLTVRFTSPLLMDDLDILSTPVSYITFDAVAEDGREHALSVDMWAFADFCHSGEYEPAMRQDQFTDGTLNYAYMGQLRQNILGGSGDHVTCDWGYLYLASVDELDEEPNRLDVVLHYRKRARGTLQGMLLIGYDDVASINYYGRILPAYYQRNGKTITQAMREFYDRREEILQRCDRFDAQLLAEARKKGGEDYALILSAAYRQAVAGHKLVADWNGQALFISKENDSNGCAATVDISYPSAPLFLMYCPELVRGMLRPIYKFARLPVWKFDFAPHDAGRYPIVTGQAYAAKHRRKRQGKGTVYPPLYVYPDTVDAFYEDRQMPVEESANMLLLTAACGKADGDYSMAKENLDLLSKWCSYLLELGADPGEQLCTDDFAGHLARNVNLSGKAIMGIAAFGHILEAIGQKEESEVYVNQAKEMAKRWLERADAGGYTRLAFGAEGWSMKYNLVWDLLMGFGLMPEDFYQREIASYLTRMERYGLPLDSRASYSKTDWILWTAAMARDEDFAKFVAPVADFLRETDNRVAFSDYFDTKTGYYERFIARSVQGGLFMPLLVDRWNP